MTIPEHNLPWWRHDRPWGFRFSTMDAGIFISGILSTIILWYFIGSFALLTPYLLGHFFLFCNTFRIGGERSLIWIGTFLANVYFWPQTRNLWLHLVIQTAITVILIVQCVLGKHYHGLACATVNPTRYRDGALSEGAFTRKVLLTCRVPKPLVEILIGRRLDDLKMDI